MWSDSMEPADKTTKAQRMFILYGPRRTKNFGLTDGEGIERLWSYLGRISSITKEMTPENRTDLLTDGLIFYGQKIKDKLDTLFFDTDPPRELIVKYRFSFSCSWVMIFLHSRRDEQKKERYHRTLAAALEFLPKPFSKVVGDSNHEHGTKLIIDILQQPKLNKQLSYVFLDIFVQELFPELRG